MTILCGPTKANFGRLGKDDMRCILYPSAEKSSEISAGATLLKHIQRAKLSQRPALGTCCHWLFQLSALIPPYNGATARTAGPAR